MDSHEFYVVVASGPGSGKSTLASIGRDFRVCTPDKPYTEVEGVDSKFVVAAGRIPIFDIDSAVSSEGWDMLAPLRKDALATGNWDVFNNRYHGFIRRAMPPPPCLVLTHTLDVEGFLPSEEIRSTLRINVDPDVRLRAMVGRQTEVLKSGDIPERDWPTVDYCGHTYGAFYGSAAEWRPAEVITEILEAGRGMYFVDGKRISDLRALPRPSGPYFGPSLGVHALYGESFGVKFDHRELSPRDIVAMNADTNTVILCNTPRLQGKYIESLNKREKPLRSHPDMDDIGIMLPWLDQLERESKKVVVRSDRDNAAGIVCSSIAVSQIKTIEFALASGLGGCRCGRSLHPSLAYPTCCRGCSKSNHTQTCVSRNLF